MLQQTRDAQQVLLGENLGGCHEGDLQAVLHGDERRQQRHNRLARADVALQETVHRLRPLHVLDDVLERLPLALRQPEWQHLPGGLADSIVDPHDERLAIVGGQTAPDEHPGLKEKGLFEDQPALGRRLESVQEIDRQVGRWKMRGQQRGVLRRQLQALPDVVGQRIRQIRGEFLKGVEHQAALDLRRQTAGALVYGHDPPRVNRLAFFVIEEFVLRIGQLQAGARTRFNRPVQDDLLPLDEDVAQERLIEPDAAHRSARVGHERFKDLEAGPSRGTQAAVENPRGDRRGLAGPERGNRLKAAPVLVPERKPVEEVFDRMEADVGELGGPTGTDALQILERRVQEGGGSPDPWVRHCTIIACPRWI